MNTVLTLRDADGAYQSAQCLRFSLVRDRYQPYASLTACFAEPTGRLPREAVLTVGGQTVFSGLIRTAAHSQQNGMRLLEITARSFSEALARNQLMPGMRSQVTPQSLLAEYPLPRLTCETGLEPVGYIYIKDRIGIWDALIALSYKHSGGFPYVRVPDHLCISPQPEENPVMLPEKRILRRGPVSDCGELISRIEMSDLDGNYGSFALDNPEAAARGVVRLQRMPFDMHYVNNPAMALAARIARANRRLAGEAVCYDGYCGEDLEDWAGIGSDFRAHVSRIVLKGDETGLQTEDTFYFDSFCNNVTV